MSEPHDISESPHVPRYALYQGRRMRVLYYQGHNIFVLLGPHDERYSAHRNQLTFPKGKSHG